MLFEVVLPTDCKVVIPDKSSRENLLTTWHERFGHVNVQAVQNTAKLYGIKDVNIKTNEKFVCEACLIGKQTRKPHVSLNRISNFQPGEKIHSDVCGPINVESPSGSKYFVLFKDENTSFRKVYFLRHKSDIFQFFKTFKAFVEIQTGNKIKVLRTDNGKEYISKDFTDFLLAAGIVYEFSSAYIHEQNGRAKRDVRTLVKSAQTMLVNKSVNKQLWTEAINTACYLLNRVLSNQKNSLTPFEKFFNKKPSVKHLRIFGSNAFINISKEKRTKLDNKSKKLLIVGYDNESEKKGYGIRKAEK